MKVFELIKGNFLLSQVFFRIGAGDAERPQLGAVVHPEYW